jgi:hypothetical protein
LFHELPGHHTSSQFFGRVRRISFVTRARL